MKFLYIFSIAICVRNYAKGVEVERECERGRDELKAIRKRRESGVKFVKLIGLKNIIFDEEKLQVGICEI